MIPTLFESLLQLVSWPIIGFVVLGTLIGMIVGAIPGINGPIVLALLIPLTFSMDPVVAIPFFGAALGGTSFGGSIPAILINTPGTAPNAATCFDGYPMAQQGRASEAIGVSATASALGALFGFAILLLLLPVARRIILAFSSPELFWLTILGLSVIAVASDTSFLRGLASGGFGLMLSFIGFSVFSGEYRYGFDTFYFYDGIPLIIALLGLFALTEILKLAAKGGTISSASSVELSFGETLKGARHVISRPSLFFRSSIIGSVIGMVPGAGGTVANFLAYIQAAQTSKDPESFGSGNPDGVLASEASNDAKDGGQLLPLIMFGLPGSAATAVLLGGLILHGLQPGPDMLAVNEGLSLTFLLIWSLIFANVTTSMSGLVTAKYLARLTLIPVKFIIPALLVVSFVGAFAIRNNFYDVVLLPVIGLLGLAMVKFNYSRIAIILGLILGPIAEVNYHQSLMISDNGYLIFVTRPISLLLIILTVLSMIIPLRQQMKQRSEAQSGDL